MSTRILIFNKASQIQVYFLVAYCPSEGGRATVAAAKLQSRVAKIWRFEDDEDDEDDEEDDEDYKDDDEGGWATVAVAQLQSQLAKIEVKIWGEVKSTQHLRRATQWVRGREQELAQNERTENRLQDVLTLVQPVLKICSIAQNAQN